MSKIVGLTIIILSFILINMGAGGVYQFFDLPSFIFVFGLTIGSLLFSLGAEGILNRSRCRELSEKFFFIAKTSALTSGVIGTLIGLIQMLSNLSNIQEVGPASGVALLSFFYASILFFIFFLWEETKGIKKSFLPKHSMGLLLGFTLCLASILLVHQSLQLL